MFTLYYLYLDLKNKHSFIIKLIELYFYPTITICMRPHIFTHIVFNLKKMYPPKIICRNMMKPPHLHTKKYESIK
jgi:hypothetical protein